MSDVINSIFGRAQNETPSSGGYGYGTTETAEATEPAAETTEAEDTVGEVADVDDVEADDTEPDSDEAVAEADEASGDDEAGESDEDSGEAVAEDTATEDAAPEDVASEDAVTEEAASEADDEAVAEETAEEPVVVTAAEPEAARPAAGSRGSTTVADGVVTKIVTRVARQAEGVHELDEAGTSVEVEGEVATIAVTLVVEFGRAVKTLAEQIRIKVIEGVEQYLGLEVASVDVHVADIHFPDAD